jgi:hypothetical protein
MIRGLGRAAVAGLFGFAGFVGVKAYHHPVTNIDVPDYSGASLGASQPYLETPTQVGSNFTVVLPASGRLVYWATSIQTSANVGNRDVFFVVEDSAGNQLIGLDTGAAIAPAKTVSFTLYDGAPDVMVTPPVLSPFQYWPLPANLFVQAGWKLVVQVDNYSADTINPFLIVLSPS